MHTVNRCPHCNRVSDTYYEFDAFQKWIDVALLRRRAWAHILFNEREIFQLSICTALFCCLVEAFVVRSTSVLLSHAPLHHQDESLLSLQLVRLIKGPYYSSMNYMTTLPRLTFYAIQEYVLIAVAAAWMGSRVRSSKNSLRRWVFVVSLATTSKLSYLFFLTWVAPSSLLPIVDVVFLLWLARGFRTLLYHQSWMLSVLFVSVCVLGRWVLRYASLWAPQILLS